jgi:RNA polymerase sigma factor (sigma-70 family)
MNSDELILENLYLVNSVARKFGELANDDDVIQCGRIGLWQAAEKWDGKREFKSFAKVCIRHAIIDHLRGIQRWESPIDTFDEVGVEDEWDIVGAIRNTFKTGSREREILLGLLKGISKQDLADRFGISRRTVTAIARKAWEELGR